MATTALIVLDHPAQHFSSGFAMLARQPQISLQVVYADAGTGRRWEPSFGRYVEWDADLFEGYDHISVGAGVSGIWNLWRLFGQRKPSSVLVYGWGTTIARVTLLICLIRRVPVLLYGDATWQHSGRTTLAPLRRLALNVLCRFAWGAVSTGTFNRDLYVQHGMRPDRALAGVCPVDSTSFRQVGAVRPSTPLGKDDERIIVFAGKLIASKAASDLLEAVAELRRRAISNWRLQIVGDGPELPALTELAKELDISEQTEFLGFQNSSAMPAILGDAHIFVLPSTRDLRALVTTEAMAAGCAAVVSSGSGIWGPGDLVEDGVTGLVYSAGSVSQLAGALSRLLADDSLRLALSRRGMDRASGYDSDDFARTVNAALLTAAGASSAGATAMTGGPYVARKDT